MRIAILVEGKTERAFKPYLIAFLQTRLPGKMPKLDFVPHDGRIPPWPGSISAASAGSAQGPANALP